MNPIYKALQTLPGNWVKGPTVDPDRGCGLNHLGIALDGDFTEWATCRDLMNTAAGEQFPERTDKVDGTYKMFMSFNDHPDTTEDDVIAVMEKAAVRYDELH